MGPPRAHPLASTWPWAPRSLRKRCKGWVAGVGREGAGLEPMEERARSGCHWVGIEVLGGLNPELSRENKRTHFDVKFFRFLNVGKQTCKNQHTSPNAQPQCRPISAMPAGSHPRASVSRLWQGLCKLCICNEHTSTQACTLACAYNCLRPHVSTPTRVLLLGLPFHSEPPSAPGGSLLGPQ